MRRALIETDEDLNSIEVTRDAKGAYKFTTKFYFGDTDEEVDKALDKTYKTLLHLKAQFGVTDQEKT